MQCSLLKLKMLYVNVFLLFFTSDLTFNLILALNSQQKNQTFIRYLLLFALNYFLCPEKHILSLQFLFGLFYACVQVQIPLSLVVYSSQITGTSMIQFL